MVTDQLQLPLDSQLCARCGEFKPRDGYSPSMRGKNGTYCRVCVAEYNREYRGVRRVLPQLRLPRTCAYAGCEMRPTSKGARYCALHRDNREPTSTEYRTVHARIARTLGKATTHPCAHGDGDHQAEEWAYDHADPGEVTGYTVRGHRCTYSLDACHYIALCRSCHAKFDKRRRYTFALTPVGRGW